MPIGIEIRGLSKSFKALKAIDDISIKFTAGGLHGLIGSDGAGKTTMLRLMLELYLKDRGDIIYTVDGKKVKFTDIRDNISYMPGKQSLYPDLSIAEHLDFFREIYMLGKEEFEERKAKLLKITRLDKFIDRKAGKLSGGMYKKLGLMCALLQQPQVLFLDEPTNGVDPISRREFWDLLYSLADDKILMIIATAYMDEAERCHEVHILDHGKVLATGEPRQLLEEEGVHSFNDFYLKRVGGEESAGASK